MLSDGAPRLARQASFVLMTLDTISDTVEVLAGAEVSDHVSSSTG
jgi:hypothetical protein